MIRKLLWLVVLVAPPAFSQSTGTIAQGQTARSCNAVTVSSSSFPGTFGGCTALALLTSGGVLPNTYTFQVTGGTATLVGSMNGTSWTTLGTATNTNQTFTGAYTWLGCIATSVSGSLNCNVSVTVGTGGGGGGGGSGVTSINSFTGDFSFTGAVTCSAATPNVCNFAGGTGGSGTVNAGAAGFFTWYPTAGTTVGSNANLDDSITTAATITSAEPLAAPQINVNGVTGTGIAMTGVGGTLPTVATGSGGVGIGPGGIPEINPNGTGWVAIPTTSGAAGVSSINGSTGAFTFAGSGVSCATTTCTFAGGTGGAGTVVANPASVGNLAFYPGVWQPSRVYQLNGMIVDSNNNIQKVTTSGTSGATAPTWATAVNATTTDNTVTWTVVGPGGDTAVAPLPNAVVAPNFSGISFGASGMPMWGTSLTTSDVSFNRIASGIIGIGNGGNTTNETNFLRSGNSCGVTTAISFTSTGLASTLCTRSFTSGVRPWIVHCAVPWNFTGGTGTSTVLIGLSVNTAQSSASNFTAVLWGQTGGPQFQVTPLPTTAGTTVLITTPALDVTQTTHMYTVFLDGVVTASATAATTISVTFQAGTAGATGQIVPGSYCRAE